MPLPKGWFAALAVLVPVAVLPAELGALEPDRRRIRTRNGADTAAVVLALSGAQRTSGTPSAGSSSPTSGTPRGGRSARSLAPLRMDPSDFVTLLVILDGAGGTAGRSAGPPTWPP